LAPLLRQQRKGPGNQRVPGSSLSLTHATKGETISEPRINDRIRSNEVRLVGPEGEQVGVVRLDIALRLAQENDLDLVEVSPNSNPPVVKIMDYGKFKYEAAQKAKEARKNQANTVLKEVRFRLKIDTHDYETKRKRAAGFLANGDKVKAMILFRGREQSRPEMGVKLLQRFAEDLAEVGQVEFTPTIDGRNMVMVIGPLKTKAEAQREGKKQGDKAQQQKPAADTPAEAPAPAAVAEAPAKEAADTEAQPAAKKPAAKKPAATAAEKPAAKAPAKPAAKAAPKATATKAAAPKTTASKPKTKTSKEEKDA
jgi:translation initiation factor IF-3